VSAAGLRVTAFGLRLVGNLFDSLGKLLVTLYDALVSPMLLGEKAVRSLRASHAQSHKKAA
jgi:hypothetical protein